MMAPENPTSERAHATAGRPSQARGDTRRRRGFVMVYAIGTMVLVSTLALSLLESTASDIEVARQRMYLVLARTAAESGIEYAMGFVTRQLGRAYDPSAPPGGPWTDPGYFFERTPAEIANPWFYSARAAGKDPSSGWPLTPQAGFTDMRSQSEGFPVRLHQMNHLGQPIPPATVGTALAPLNQVTQFQISMTPEMTYQNVRIATMNEVPTIFTVRSRGEVLYNDGTNPGGQPTVLSSVFVIQTFFVPQSDGKCGNPRPVRQVFDREPRTLTPGPNPARGPSGASYDQRLQTPNPH